MLLRCGKLCPSGARQFKDLVRSESLKKSEAVKNVMQCKIITSVETCLMVSAIKAFIREESFTSVVDFKT